MEEVWAVADVQTAVLACCRLGWALRARVEEEEAVAQRAVKEGFEITRRRSLRPR